MNKAIRILVVDDDPDLGAMIKLLPERQDGDNSTWILFINFNFIKHH